MQIKYFNEFKKVQRDFIGRALGSSVNPKLEASDFNGRLADLVSTARARLNYNSIAKYSRPNESAEKSALHKDNTVSLLEPTLDKISSKIGQSFDSTVSQLNSKSEKPPELKIPDIKVKKLPTSQVTSKEIAPRPLASESSLLAPEIVSAKRVSLSEASPHKAIIFDLVHEAADRHGIDPLLGLSIIEAESSYRTDAISSDGYATKGLFQLRDSTGRELIRRHLPTEDYDPFDPELNIELGMLHLKHLREVFSQSTPLNDRIRTFGIKEPQELAKFTTAAFNAGEGRVARAQRRAELAGFDPQDFAMVEPYLPGITQNYVKKVLSNPILER